MTALILQLNINQALSAYIGKPITQLRYIISISRGTGSLRIYRSVLFNIVMKCGNLFNQMLGRCF